MKSNLYSLKVYNEDLDVKYHEKIAKGCFNQTWDLIDKKERSPEEDINIIRTAHASRYHWGIFYKNWTLQNIYILLINFI